MTRSILALIPARGGSKGIPNKNMKLLEGKPLLYYTVTVALQTKLITKIGLSSDSSGIINYYNSFGFNETYVRPDFLAGDTISSLDVVQHYLHWQYEQFKFRPEFILLLQPTSPLRIVEDIERSIEIMLANKDADSLVSVVEAPHSFIPESIMQLKGEFLEPFLKNSQLYQRQQKPNYYGRNGAAIYLSTYDCIMKKNSFYGQKCLAYVMPKNRSVDIDDMFDFELCEYLIKKGK